jgi:hypothetical protein
LHYFAKLCRAHLRKIHEANLRNGVGKSSHQLTSMK